MIKLRQATFKVTFSLFPGTNVKIFHNCAHEKSGQILEMAFLQSGVTGGNTGAIADAVKSDDKIIINQ